jgi:two-component system, chemotaxis family, chemotaxis protein CheY
MLLCDAVHRHASGGHKPIRSDGSPERTIGHDLKAAREIMVNQLTDMRVLVADDHFLIRQVVSNTLQEAKISNVQMTGDGHEAIELVKKARDAGQPYNIVFLDWNMPTVSGLEVLNYFRAKQEYADTAFVMLTVESDQDKVMTAIKAGATSYIVKPVSQAHLGRKLAEIYEWIKRRRQAGQSGILV